MRDASQFKSGENIVIYGEFIYVSCILCVGVLEDFKL